MPNSEEMIEAERIARLFHEAYEELAPSFGYRTREASAVPWERVPESNRRLMIATAGRVLSRLDPEKERLAQALVDHNDRLRSACSVADRNGQNTNWRSLRGEIHYTLAEHHETVNEARATLNSEVNHGRE